MHDVRLKRAVIAAALLTVSLWIIQIAGTMMALRLELLSVRPGAPAGLHGVVTAPLVHGSFIHLLANTPPLLVLGPAMLYGFPHAARSALPHGEPRALREMRPAHTGSTLQGLTRRAPVRGLPGRT